MPEVNRQEMVLYNGSVMVLDAPDMNGMRRLFVKDENGEITFDTTYGTDAAMMNQLQQVVSELVVKNSRR